MREDNKAIIKMPMVKAPMRHLAVRRLQYRKSGTLLTAVAMVLTTCLVMTVGTMGLGLVRMQQELTVENYGNHHGHYSNVSWEQLEMLENHAQIESISANELFASVIKDKMNASLGTYEDRIPGIYNRIAMVEGTYPEQAHEIAGPPAFFERLGYEAPAIGDSIEVSFRVKGEGQVITEVFEIVGLAAQRDMSDLDVADTRIVYSAFISKELTDYYLAPQEHYYRAYVRIKGEENYNSTELSEELENIAAGIGLDKTAVNENAMYMMWNIDPAIETMVGVAGISALIIFFAGMVIYSIYYVSVISNVKELGKLKAIGAGKRQMKKLLWWEGIITAVISIPIGLLLGYLFSHIGMKMLISFFLDQMGSYQVGSLLSLPAVLFSIACTLITVVISLRRPMKMASRISPIEALRYREQGTDARAERSGYAVMNVRRLAFANLIRNKRRSMVTIISMGLGGILFLSVSAVTSSMNEDDYLRQQLRKGDFYLELRYSTNDATYPENNLDAMQTEDLLGKKLMEQLQQIPGITQIEADKAALAYMNHPSPEFEAGKRLVIQTITREEAAQLDSKKGSLDYDQLIEKGGIIFGSDYFWDTYGMTLGEQIPLTFVDGAEEKPFEATLMASTDVGYAAFLIPEELFDQIMTEVNPFKGLYIHAEEEQYEQVKAALNELVDEQIYFSLMSYDEEYAIAQSFMQATRYAVYVLLAILGFIVFINFVNTMVTSIVVRRNELAALQAIGLSNRQLARMLQWEGGVFTAGTILIAVTVGNMIGYEFYQYCVKAHLMGIKNYHYPLAQTLLLFVVLVVFQYAVTGILANKVKKESLVMRMRK